MNSNAQDYMQMPEEPEKPLQPFNVITDDVKGVDDGISQIRTGVGAGIHEEDLDKQFFNKHLS